MGKPHALRGQIVNRWRSESMAAMYTKVPVSKIVSEDNNDIGANCRGGLLSHQFIDRNQGFFRRIKDIGINAFRVRLSIVDGQYQQ